MRSGQPIDSKAHVDAFLKRYEEDWIKAGAPSVLETLAMVNEILRLRALMTPSDKATTDAADGGEAGR